MAGEVAGEMSGERAKNSMRFAMVKFAICQLKSEGMKIKLRSIRNDALKDKITALKIQTMFYRQNKLKAHFLVSNLFCKYATKSQAHLTSLEKNFERSFAEFGFLC